MARATSEPYELVVARAQAEVFRMLQLRTRVEAGPDRFEEVAAVGLVAQRAARGVERDHVGRSDQVCP